MNATAISPTFRPADRIQKSFLSAPEHRALQWLAVRTPQSINSDHLTALGLVAMLAAGLAYAAAAIDVRWIWISSICLALNWLGDSLDGTLARFRRQTRPRYGFYVDHLVDAIGALALLSGLAVSGYMHSRVAVALLLTYYLLFMEAVLATYTLAVFQISIAKFGPTELRLLLVIGNAFLLWKPYVHLFGGVYRLFDVGGFCGAIGMALMFVYQASVHTCVLYRQETLR